jgi:hypothetical protein
MATKHMNQSSAINSYHKRFKAADGETSSSNTIKDNIQIATATTTITVTGLLVLSAMSSAVKIIRC